MKRKVVVDGRTFAGLRALEEACYAAAEQGDQRTWERLYAEAIDWKRAERAGHAQPGARNTEAGASFGSARETPDESVHPQLRALRAEGEQAISRMRSEFLTDAAAERLGELIEQDRSGLDSRYLAAVSSAAFERAFWKRTLRPDSAQFEMTADEAEAMRRAVQVEQERALGLGSSGDPVPAALDPSIILTSDGRINPLRQLATVSQVATAPWRGVASEGIVATSTRRAPRCRTTRRR